MLSFHELNWVQGKEKTMKKLLNFACLYGSPNLQHNDMDSKH